MFSQSTNSSKFGINNFLNRWANHGLSFVYFYSFQTQILQQKLQASAGFKLRIVRVKVKNADQPAGPGIYNLIYCIQWK